jgi:hypothetical protein
VLRLSAVIIMMLPSAEHEYTYRYVILAVALACVAAGLAFRQPPVTPDSRALDAPGSGRRRFRRAVVVRSVAHLAVWAPFIYALTNSLLHAWVPIGDNATTALRSWDALSAHGPLVGAPTRLAHGVFDLGPMEYWLLTVPVHLDPAQGVWLGGALWCMLAGSLAIEAASSAAGELGTVVASGIILGVVAWIPQIATWLGPAWNPWFGMVFFIAALAACWAVMSGRRQWWPVLAVTGSVAAQAHDMYAIAAVSLVLAGFLAVVVDSLSSRKYRWALVGVIAALGCWTAPLIQQFTSRTGNLTAIADSLRKSGPGAGVSFGLKALSAATQPPASWWEPVARLSTIESREAWFGVLQSVIVVLALIIAICVLRSRRAAALAVLSLVIGVATLLTFSSVPASNIAVSPLSYLMAPLFPVGVLAWLAVGAVLILAGTRAMRWLRRRTATRHGVDRGAVSARMMTAPWGPRIAGLAAVALIASASYGTALVVSRMPATPEDPVMRAVSSVSRQIEQEISVRRVALAVLGRGNPFRRRLTFGLAYALGTAGYAPEIQASWAVELGPGYGFSGVPVARVTVFLHKKRGSSARVVITRP